MADVQATQRLGTEKVSKLLMEYAIPSVIAMTASVLYNLADSIFIGHGVGPLAISALTLCMPLMNISAAFGAMVGVGAASLMSIKLGQHDRSSAKDILGNVVMLNSILGLSFGIICLIFLDPILYSFGASDATIGYAREYMSIILIGNVFTHLYLGLNNLMRASGAPRKSMTYMLVAVFGNVILDALFIFGFGWGIAGAAWATVLAQVAAMILEIIYFSNKKNEIHFVKGIIRLKKNIVKGILSIGMAPFLMNISSSVIVIFINNALMATGGANGDMYIAAYGNVNRLASVFIMIIFGINQGLQPIVGYNFGAKKFDRVKEGLKLAIMAATGVMVIGFLMAMLIPRQAAMMFTTDAFLLDLTAHAMTIVMALFPLVGFQVVASSFFQSIGKAHKAIFLSLTRQLLFLLPMLIILPPRMGPDGVWWSIPIADSVAIVITFFILRQQFSQFRREGLNA